MCRKEDGTLRGTKFYYVHKIVNQKFLFSAIYLLSPLFMYLVIFARVNHQVEKCGHESSPPRP